MILRLSYEEVAALNSAAEQLLSSAGGGLVVAPPEVMAEIESRLPLEGDITIPTLARQRRLLGAVEHVMDHLRRRMDALILDQYVGSEDAVNAYFDYANVLTLHTKLEAAGREMVAMIELMTGEAATEEAAEGTAFPD